MTFFGTDGPTDGHDLLQRCDGASKNDSWKGKTKRAKQGRERGGGKLMKATLTKEKRERGTHFEAKIFFAKKKKDRAQKVQRKRRHFWKEKSRKEMKTTADPRGKREGGGRGDLTPLSLCFFTLDPSPFLPKKRNCGRIDNMQLPGRQTWLNGARGSKKIRFCRRISKNEKKKFT